MPQPGHAGKPCFVMPGMHKPIARACGLVIVSPSLSWHTLQASNQPVLIVE
jgi:hypothetical protein